MVVFCKELLQVATWLVFVRSCCRWQHGGFLFAGSCCKRQQSWFLHISWSQGVTELWKFVAAHWVKWQHRLFSMSGGTGVYHEFAAELVVHGFVAGGRGMGLLWYWTIELVKNDLEGQRVWLQVLCCGESHILLHVKLSQLLRSLLQWAIELVLQESFLVRDDIVGGSSVQLT